MFFYNFGAGPSTGSLGPGTGKHRVGPRSHKHKQIIENLTWRSLKTGPIVLRSGATYLDADQIVFLIFWVKSHYFTFLDISFSNRGAIHLFQEKCTYFSSVMLCNVSGHELSLKIQTLCISLMNGQNICSENMHFFCQGFMIKPFLLTAELHFCLI